MKQHRKSKFMIEFKIFDYDIKKLKLSNSDAISLAEWNHQIFTKQLFRFLEG